MCVHAWSGTISESCMAVDEVSGLNKGHGSPGAHGFFDGAASVENSPCWMWRCFWRLRLQAFQTLGVFLDWRGAPAARPHSFEEPDAHVRPTSSLLLKTCRQENGVLIVDSHLPRNRSTFVVARLLRVASPIHDSHQTRSRFRSQRPPWSACSALRCWPASVLDSVPCMRMRKRPPRRLEELLCGRSSACTATSPAWAWQ